MLGSILFGSSVIPESKIEDTLNQYAAEGWKLDFMLIERRRLMFFWQRETAIITLCKEE